MNTSESPTPDQTKHDWKRSTLGELVTFCSGGTPSKSLPELWGGGLPWVSAKDLKVSVLHRSIDTLTQLGFQQASRTPAGSLLILVRGMTLHRDVPVCIAGTEVAFNQDLKALVPSNDILGRFLRYYLIARKDDLLVQVESSGHGTGKLDTDILKEFLVQVPPLQEQELIVDFIETWDSLIEKLERLIVAKGTLLSGTLTQNFKKALVGQNPGWQIRELGDFLVEHGKTSSGTEPVYSVSVHKGLVNQVEHLGRSFSAEATGHYNLVHPGDIVYTKSPTGEFPLGIIKQSAATENVIVSPLYGVFTPRDPELGLVIDGLFSSPSITGNYLRPLVQKGAKNTIAVTNARFLSGVLAMPIEKGVTNTMANMIRGANKELEVLKRLVEAYRRQRQVLMAKLLTGKWRIGTMAHE